jgi:pimeloyl-ACP methyl ester carboxylesterase
MYRVNQCKTFIAIAVMALFLAGCVAAPTVPIASLSYQSDLGQRQRNLLVMLRGMGADYTIFEKEGIIDEIRRRGLPFDVVAPDAHLGYYQSYSIETRLKEDIIDPARRLGYERIWLVGFSMGGLGSMLYASRYPGDIHGVLLCSPFLGGSPIYEEIRLAGGVNAWSASVDDATDAGRSLWTWIKNRDRGIAPPIWLGYGESDGVIAEGALLLASVLPAEQVFTVPGSHNVATLKAVFLRHLDTLAR